MIKACDKGAGIIILNFNDYMPACYKHLLSKTANNKPHFSQVDDFAVERTQKKINSILEEGIEESLIMQITALSFTERSGHCGATSSDR